MKKPYLEAFGERLRYELKRNNIPVSELADKTGLSRPGCSMLFNRASCPKRNSRIFKAIDILPEIDWEYVMKGYEKYDPVVGSIDENDYFYDAISSVKRFMISHGLSQVSCLNLTIKHEGI